MLSVRTLASLALVAGLCVLTGCEPCSTTKVQESELDGQLLWHTASGDLVASPWKNTDTTKPVVYQAGMFDIFFDVPSVGSRALVVFDQELETSAPGSHSLDGMTAWISPVAAGEPTTEGVEQITLKGTLEVRSIDRSSVDATFDIADSGDTGPRGTFDVKASSTSEQSTCVRKSLY